jgi:hypothetical protein
VVPNHTHNIDFQKLEPITTVTLVLVQNIGQRIDIVETVDGARVSLTVGETHAVVINGAQMATLIIMVALV